jgi:DNA-binding Xre family transcriptional regulator
VKWKLKEYLDKHHLTPHQLVVESGLSVNTVYPMARGNAQRISLETLDKIVAALRTMTQERVGIGDLLEYEDKEVSEPTPAWQALAGIFDDPASPGDVSARVDEYLEEALVQDHEESAKGKR